MHSETIAEAVKSSTLKSRQKELTISDDPGH